MKRMSEQEQREQNQKVLNLLQQIAEQTKPQQKSEVSSKETEVEAPKTDSSHVTEHLFNPSMFDCPDCKSKIYDEIRRRKATNEAVECGRCGKIQDKKVKCEECGRSLF